MGDSTKDCQVTSVSSPPFPLSSPHMACRKVTEFLRVGKTKNYGKEVCEQPGFDFVPTLERKPWHMLTNRYSSMSTVTLYDCSKLGLCKRCFQENE